MVQVAESVKVVWRVYNLLPILSDLDFLNGSVAALQHEKEENY